MSQLTLANGICVLAFLQVPLDMIFLMVIMEMRKEIPPITGMKNGPLFLLKIIPSKSIP